MTYVLHRIRFGESPATSDECLIYKASERIGEKFETLTSYVADLLTHIPPRTNSHAASRSVKI